MSILKSLICLGAALNVANAVAQNTFPSSGNVGIGTTNPSQILQVAGGNPVVSLTGSGIPSLQILSTSSTANEDFRFEANRYSFGEVSVSDCSAGCVERITIAKSGNVGIGTTSVNPNYRLEVSGTTKVDNSLISLAPYNTMPIPSVGVVPLFTGKFDDYYSSSALLFGSLPYLGTWIQSAQDDSSGGAVTGWKNLYLQPSGGSVGIGTTSPGYSLDVSGKIHTNNSVVYPDGSSQTTAWTGVLCGGDYAEAVEAAGDQKAYEPGDVLVLASDGKHDVAKSSEPYSTLVAGIYATKPGVIGRRQSLPKEEADLPMAMVGIVPTKVSAENGPIHRGDLLVSSSTPGFAMKGTDRSRLVGAVIGKAMGTLNEGNGVIQVLVTLQ